MTEGPTIYFVVRKDLSKGQIAAQLAHVALEWAATYPYCIFGNTVVVYAVPGLVELSKTLEWLLDQKRSYCTPMPIAFYEPDLDGEMTAIATLDGPMILPLL